MFVMKKNFFLYFLVSFAPILVLASLFFLPSKKIMDHDGYRILGQYISLNSHKTDLAGFKVALETQDPLQATSYIFSELYNHRNINAATTMMELLLAQWNIRKRTPSTV